VIRALAIALALATAAGLAAACVSTQDYGGAAPTAPGPEAGLDGATPSATFRWEWVNPSPTGRTLAAIAGLDETNLWVAGEGGTIARFDGVAFQPAARRPSINRYFAIGVTSARPSEVHVAGLDASGAVVVERYDGTSWVESYPFAGSSFRAFSHGPGPRLFAITGGSIAELSSDGTWVPTSAMTGEHGDPVDVWVAPSGEAWAITGEGWDIPTATTTIGAWLLHLPAGSRTWSIEAPPATVPLRSSGLAISGEGEEPCAFYTGQDPRSPAGFLRRSGGASGAWAASPVSANPLAAEPEGSLSRGARSTCAGGGGLLVRGEHTVVASGTTAAPTITASGLPERSLRSAIAWGTGATHAVGALGSFVTWDAGKRTWQSRLPISRRDILAVDVAGDGTAMAVDSISAVSGGQTLIYQDGLLVPAKGKGLLGPSLPLAVAVVAADDAWVLTGDGRSLGYARWTGAWSVTTPIASGMDGLAIWAAAPDDVWVTGRESCPDLVLDPVGGCSKKDLAGFAWHREGTGWKRFATESPVLAIHGTGPGDVWFAGDVVSHWNGAELAPVPGITGKATGVWAAASDRVWLWGERALLWNGATATPIREALGAATDWIVSGVAESAEGDVFVLTRQARGSALLWFDGATKKLEEQITSDLELRSIRGRGNELWAVGASGAALRFAPPALR